MVTCCSRGCCLLLTDLSLHRDVARSVVRGNTWRGDRGRWGAVGWVRLASQRSAAVTTCNGNNVNFNIWMVTIGFYNYIVYDCIYWYFKKFKVSKKLLVYYWWISNLSFTLFTQTIKCTRMLRSQTCYKFKKHSTKWLHLSSVEVSGVWMLVPVQPSCWHYSWKTPHLTSGFEDSVVMLAERIFIRILDLFNSCLGMRRWQT